jgi:hypothetical protein
MNTKIAYMTNERTIELKTVKQALAKEFGFKNVSVIGGKGTAYGWIEVTVNVHKYQKDQNENLSAYVETIVRRTGVKMFKYTDDMDYTHECLLVNIREIE